MPDGRMYFVDSEEQWADVGLRNADEAVKRRQRLEWIGRRGTEVPDREDSGTSWRPAYRWFSLARPANGAHHAGVSSDRVKSRQSQLVPASTR